MVRHAAFGCPPLPASSSFAVLRAGCPRSSAGRNAESCRRPVPGSAEHPGQERGTQVSRRPGHRTARGEVAPPTAHRAARQRRTAAGHLLPEPDSSPRRRRRGTPPCPQRVSTASPASLDRLTRVCIAAGTGGAALALPLVAVGHASAAEPATAAAARPPPPRPPRRPPTWYRRRHAVEDRRRPPRQGRLEAALQRQQEGHRRQPEPDPPRPAPHAERRRRGTTGRRKPPPPRRPRHRAPKAAPSKTAAAVTSASGYTKPVGDAAIGTPYHADGLHLVQRLPHRRRLPGRHRHPGPLGRRGHRRARRRGRRLRQRRDHPARRRQVHPVRPPDPAAVVSVGQSVTDGQEIGISGATGNVTGPHLHFEVRTTPNYGSDIDPVAYLPRTASPSDPNDGPAPPLTCPPGLHHRAGTALPAPAATRTARPARRGRPRRASDTPCRGGSRPSAGSGTAGPRCPCSTGPPRPAGRSATPAG